MKNRRERWPERRVLRRKREFDDPRFRCPALGSMNARTSTIHSELASVASSLLRAWPLICCDTVSLLIRAECFAVGGRARLAICGPHAHRFGAGCLQGTASSHQESVNGTEIGVCSKERDNENPRR